MKLEFDKDGKIIVPETTIIDESNIVFKCNWNDKGWKDICSKKAREYNVSMGRDWCCDRTNECVELIKNNRKGFPCTESRLFIDFRVDPGTYLKGKKRGDEKYIRGAQKGKLAFLTTVSPDIDEKDRYFIGIFDIERIEEDRNIYGNKQTSIVILPEIRLKFWDYYKNKDGSTFWGSRQRYIDDAIALKILIELKQKYEKLIGFEKEKENLNMLIERYKKYVYSD